MLQKFLQRVNRAVAIRGKKTELAQFIGSTRQQVNAWLNGSMQPGGEVTLLMLEWVTAEEAKQNKKRGSVVAPPRRKTRKAQTYEEKDKRVRKRS